ncbi:hypothetical protein AU511_11440 [Lonsdalea iberica]|uniref:Uncharacterized protein n=1 Tax=Lonsdalea iberica TaxID=1082703 RepID=A0A1X3RSN1_9GAMM|nr:hypothetical protein AU511_11440 [Lonsdalea iberica]
MSLPAAGFQKALAPRQWKDDTRKITPMSRRGGAEKRAQKMTTVAVFSQSDCRVGLAVKEWTPRSSDLLQFVENLYFPYITTRRFAAIR